MDTILAICVGIGLSAACGFRVFVPLLALGLSTKLGILHPGPSFAWLGSWPALLALALATMLEIGAYYIPWLDNLLDTLMTPLAVIAGVLTTAALTGDLPPLLQWALALIAGGGVSGLVQSGTVALRAGSTATTLGLANPLVSTLELLGSIALVLVSLLLPFLALALALLVLFKMAKALLRRRQARLSSL